MVSEERIDAKIVEVCQFLSGKFDKLNPNRFKSLIKPNENGIKLIFDFTEHIEGSYIGVTNGLSFYEIYDLIEQNTQDFIIYSVGEYWVAEVNLNGQDKRKG